MCAGTNVEGQSCNDNNSQTINDKYVNGLCVGTLAPNGTPCDDGNIQTINDKYTNGICKGTNVENQACDDGNAQTINDKYHNGVCTGTNVQGQACNDSNLFTSNDKYNNGICVGTEMSFSKTVAIFSEASFASNNLNWTKSGTTYTSSSYFANKFFNLPASGKYKISITMDNAMRAGIGTAYNSTWTTTQFIGNMYSSGITVTPTPTSMGRVLGGDYAAVGGAGTYYIYIDMDNKVVQITNTNLQLVSSEATQYFTDSDLAYEFGAGRLPYLFISDSALKTNGSVTINYIKQN